MSAGKQGGTHNRNRVYERRQHLLQDANHWVSKYQVCSWKGTSYFIYLSCLFQSPSPLESMLNEDWNCLLFTHPGPWTLLGIYNICSINKCRLAGWMIGGWVDEWMNGWVDQWMGFNIQCQKTFLAGKLPPKGPLRVTSMGLCSYQLPGLVRTVTASTCHPYI